ncbi:hypothetical protein IQ267_18245 [filamentous cyanobacterium LEGE 07170]|nr:hypothetical protein [filamentous cyanobacterium LEGE 07170]
MFESVVDTEQIENHRGTEDTEESLHALCGDIFLVPLNWVVGITREICVGRSLTTNLVLLNVLQ